MREKRFALAGAVCVAATAPSVVAAAVLPAAAASGDQRADGRGGAGYACVATPRPSAADSIKPTAPVVGPTGSPDASPSPPVPARSVAAWTPPTDRPSLAIPALPVSHLRAIPAIAMPAPTPPVPPSTSAAPVSLTTVSPAASPEQHGMLPALARHLRRRFPLLLIVLFVALVPAVLALWRGRSLGR